MIIASKYINGHQLEKKLMVRVTNSGYKHQADVEVQIPGKCVLTEHGKYDTEIGTRIGRTKETFQTLIKVL